jgi:hypothetical protein
MTSFRWRLLHATRLRAATPLLRTGSRHERADWGDCVRGPRPGPYLSSQPTSTWLVPRSAMLTAVSAPHGYSPAPLTLYSGLSPRTWSVPGGTATHYLPSAPTETTREAWVSVFVTCTAPGRGRGEPGAGPPTATSVPLTLPVTGAAVDETSETGIELDGLGADWPELLQAAVVPKATIPRTASAVYMVSRRCHHAAPFAIRLSGYPAIGRVAR